MGVYSPTSWVNNQTPAINANNLNKLEAGVQVNSQDLEDFRTGAQSVKHSETSDHATTVNVATQTTVGGAKIWVDTTDPDNIIGHIDAR